MAKEEGKRAWESPSLNSIYRRKGKTEAPIERQKIKVNLAPVFWQNECA